MIKNIIHLIVFSIIMTSCFSDNPKSNGTSVSQTQIESSIYIDLQQKSKNILNVSEFADTVMYIPLETNSKSFLRRITQIQITDTYIFINGYDRLLLFSKDGKFIRQIGRKGKGPGEHLSIFCFAVNQDTVYISSSGKRSLIKYMVNGDFLEEQPTSSQLVHFSIMPDNKLVSYNEQSGELFFFDWKLNVIDTILVDNNVSDKRAIYSYRDSFDSFFQKSVNRLLFTNYMSDTIWDVSNRRKDIGYVLNLGDQLLPKKYRIEYFGGDFEHYRKTAAPFQKIKLIETPSFTFLFQKGWIDNYINATYIHNVTTNTTQKFEGSSIFDDLVGKLTIDQEFSSDNSIIGKLEPVDLIKELKQYDKQNRNSNKTPSPLWLEQMAKVKENDNNILVVMPVRNKTEKK